MDRAHWIMVIAGVTVVPVAVTVVLAALGLFPDTRLFIAMFAGIALLLWWFPGSVHSRNIMQTLEIVVVGAGVIYLLGVGIRAADGLTVAEMYAVLASDVAFLLSAVL